jgi:hypothetical protein
MPDDKSWPRPDSRFRSDHNLDRVGRIYVKAIQPRCAESHEGGVWWQTATPGVKDVPWVRLQVNVAIELRSDSLPRLSVEGMQGEAGLARFLKSERALRELNRNSSLRRHP